MSAAGASIATASARVTCIRVGSRASRSSPAGRCNARRGKLAPTAEAWTYGSLYPGERQPEHRVQLSAWPVRRPADWIEQVNVGMEDAELDRLRLHIQRGRPLGTMAWTVAAAKRMGLEQTLRDRGRPSKKKGAK